MRKGEPTAPTRKPAIGTKFDFRSYDKFMLHMQHKLVAASRGRIARNLL